MSLKVINPQNELLVTNTCRVLHVEGFWLYEDEEVWVGDEGGISVDRLFLL